jgi:hypothetical protein
VKIPLIFVPITTDRKQVDLGRKKEVFPLVLIQVKSEAKRMFLGLKSVNPSLIFVARIGEIITDMPYLCETEIEEQERAIFLFFPSFEDKLRLKTLNLQFLTKKQVIF